MQHIKRDPQAATIKWIPPFSLNITGVEPDILYNIEIFNITCGRRDPILHKGDVAKTSYFNRSLLQKADLYEIIIIPRSNVMGSSNGPSTKIRGRCIHCYYNYEFSKY